MCPLQLYGRARDVCSHVAAVLFTAEANTQVKNRTSSTSLPCAWLPPSFQTVPFVEVADMDFTTPRCKRKASFHEMNEDNVSTDEDDDVSVVAVSSSSSFMACNVKPQESSIARFYRVLLCQYVCHSVLLLLCLRVLPYLCSHHPSHCYLSLLCHHINDQCQTFVLKKHGATVDKMSRTIK